MKISVVLQFGEKDELDFRAALSKGGMARIDGVLEGIDATKAEATLRSDLNMILLEIEGSMGLRAFNEMIRDGIRAEYKKPREERVAVIPLRARPTYTTPLALAHTTTKTHSKHATTDLKSERAVLRCLRARLAAYGMWFVLLFDGLFGFKPVQPRT